MLKDKFAVTLCALLLLALVLHESVSAQSEEKKFEVGAQVSGLAGGSFGGSESVGGGGRFTYNLSNYLALEGELNYFTSTGPGDFHRFQGQFGVKSGLRFKRFGLFGKLRPGFINTKEDFLVFFPIPCLPGTVCIPSTIPISGTNSDTGFSLDLGGVAELYPSKRIVVRFDFGDTILSRQDRIIFLDQALSGRQPILGLQSPVFDSITIPAGRNSATHNLQLSAGVGFRF